MTQTEIEVFTFGETARKKNNKTQKKTQTRFRKLLTP